MEGKGVGERRGDGPGCALLPQTSSVPTVLVSKRATNWVLAGLLLYNSALCTNEAL